ncbi:unnamed protein product [Protopolystoma xenopodis]|uniref:Uncharacterized protein n=1 Tax=Protopolystoma xenopodis TaxID=117903 RepID=A0A3S5CVK8_9PLAT|nr:unnamed protein product [Protopolystoma xenopodis]
MISCSDDLRHMTDESLAPFLWNRRRLARKQRQHEYSSKANRQLVKRNQASSSGGTDLQISSPNTFTRNGIRDRNRIDAAAIGASGLTVVFYKIRGPCGKGLTMTLTHRLEPRISHPDAR